MDLKHQSTITHSKTAHTEELVTFAIERTHITTVRGDQGWN